MKNSEFRVVARSVLQDRGFNVRVTPGRGYLPGSRLTAVQGQLKMDVAVKASQQRAINFTRQENNRWRTLSAVDLVVAVVPSERGAGRVDVYGFERKALVRVFDRAWKALNDADRSTGFNAPVFVSLDERSRKNVGHAVGNLKEFALWSCSLTEKQLEKHSQISDESYIDEFRRRFAAENGVDIAQVLVTIGGKLK